MQRIKLMTGLLCAALLVSVPASAQAPATKGGVLDVPIHHVGLVVRDVSKSAKAYAELLGVPVPPIQEVKGITFPADFKGDKKAHLKAAMFQLNGVGVQMVEPVGGASPWRDHLDKFGEGLYSIAIYGVPSASQAAAMAVAKGGKQVVGGPGAKTVMVDLKNVVGFAMEFSEQPAVAMSPGEGSGRFVDNPIRYVSVVVPEIEKPMTTFAELMGVAVPKVADPKIQYPADFTGDREGHPRLGMVTLSGMDVAYTSPVGGKTPWSDVVAKTGPTLHHLGVGIKGMAENIAMMEKLGAHLVIGGPTLGYCWMDFYPKLPMVFELNGR